MTKRIGEKRRKLKQTIGKSKKIVPKRFLKWKKVFRKVESKRTPTKKFWDYAIDFKEMFKPQKRRIYLLSKDKRKEV